MGNRKTNLAPYLVFFFLFASFFVLLVRSFDLMVIQGRRYAGLAKDNRIKEIKIPAVRGKILDRNGVILAEDQVAWRSSQGDWLTKDESLALKVKGELVDQVLQRRYFLGEAAAHLIGFLGKVSKEELGQYRCPQRRLKYYFEDWIGREGLESQNDCSLAGREGRGMVELNARGQIVREIGQVKPVKGEDLPTTIDSRVQKAAWEAIGEAKGAVVILNPQNGEVLSLVSSPSFDPNFFGVKPDGEKIRAWLGDKDNLPFVNRAISAAYHPGSIFKIVTATAGLEEGKITSQTEVEDTGVITVGKWQYGNWYWLEYGQKEGMVNLIKAIKRSNDIYFYKVGEWTGAEKISFWAGKFNLGRKTYVDLPGEAKGLVPSPEWKQKTKGEPWFLGNTYHFAIGQGDLTMTPLQAAVMTGVIANEGKLCPPHLVGAIDGQKSKDCQDLGIKQEYMQLIKRGMVEVCQPKGTAFPFFGFQPQVGCKTGTAEVGDGTDDAHAWFTLFAPADNPKVVVTVFVERGGSGAYVAAPIAKKIMENEALKALLKD